MYSKKFIAFFICLLISAQLFSQRKKILAPINTEGVRATHTNVAYGSHERNVLDIWLAESETPTPLVVYIHGGGFMNGDKSRVYDREDIAQFLKHGISFASVNYRFMPQQEERLLGCMKDSKRAIQFLRTMAEEWNIDKTRVGAYGGSASAGTSLWLGFHDDMADPAHGDPVFRESTRLTVIGALATQATYDFTKWMKLLEMEDAGETQVAGLMLRGAMALGLKKVEDMESEEGKQKLAEVDFLGMISQDDPPVYIDNDMRGGKIDPQDLGHLQHHPLHALALKKELDKINHPSQVYARKMGVAPPESEQETLPEYFIRHLKE